MFSEWDIGIKVVFRIDLFSFVLFRVRFDLGYVVMPLLPGFLSWFCVQILLGSFIGVVSLLWRFIVGSGVMSVGVFSMVGPTMFLSLFVCGMGGFRTLVRDEGDVILLITERFGGRDL